MEKQETYFYLNKCIESNVSIYRYLDIDSFLQILNGDFFVSKKRRFADGYDAGTKVPFKEIATNFLRVVGDDIAIPQKPFNLEQVLGVLQDSQEYLVSCWTKNEDDFLMWNAYTQSSCSVCLQSTISNFVASLTSIDDYSILCSPMFYDGFTNIGELEDVLFRKQRMYMNENEIRFYFLDTVLGTPIKYNLGKEAFGTILKVKADVMIDKLILSPKMRGNSADILIQLLEEKYPFLNSKVVKSKININK